MVQEGLALIEPVPPPIKDSGSHELYCAGSKSLGPFGGAIRGSGASSRAPAFPVPVGLTPHSVNELDHDFVSGDLDHPTTVHLVADTKLWFHRQSCIRVAVSKRYTSKEECDYDSCWQEELSFHVFPSFFVEIVCLAGWSRTLVTMQVVGGQCLHVATIEPIGLIGVGHHR